MQYDLYCYISDSNMSLLLLLGFSPETRNGPLYIASWLDIIQFNFALQNMQGSIEGLLVSTNKISAKEANRTLSEMRIQYIQGRWNREFYNVFI